VKEPVKPPLYLFRVHLHRDSCADRCDPDKDRNAGGPSSGRRLGTGVVWCGVATATAATP
jgi:hypothetical protein